MKGSYKYIWGYSVLNLMFAYTLIQVRDRKFIPTLFENSILSYLGKISYGLYVFHLPVIWSISHIMPSHSLLILGLLSLLVSILISAISYELMEKPFIRLKDKYFSRNSANNTLNQTEAPLRLVG